MQKINSALVSSGNRLSFCGRISIVSGQIRTFFGIYKLEDIPFPAKYKIIDPDVDHKWENCHHIMFIMHQIPLVLHTVLARPF